MVLHVSIMRVAADFKAKGIAMALPKGKRFNKMVHGKELYLKNLEHFLRISSAAESSADEETRWRTFINFGEAFSLLEAQDLR